MNNNKEMDLWDKSYRDFTVPKSRKTPSFSSSLLDSIYRSIDESNGNMESLLSEERATRRRPTSACFDTMEEDMPGFRRAIVFEKWVDKQSDGGSGHSYSVSSSSDSSCGGGGGVFSSSEAESNAREKSRSSGFALHRAKPVRTGVTARNVRLEKPTHCEQRNPIQQQKPKHEGRFMKTKSRALKMYGDLKKVKHPISPGGRIASFINSLFSSSNAKKAKPCSSETSESISFRKRSKSAHASPTCSSVSSFSRSCLSKTSSSRGNRTSDGLKRCVRFYPVSVIVDEDCRPCGHKSLYGEDPSLTPTSAGVRKLAETELKNKVFDRTHQVEAIARDLLRGYQKKCMNEHGLRDLHNYDDDDDDENDNEEEDDAESCSSSDLFELDNLIGIGRYQEELPVYETTNVRTNLAIANGLIL